MLKKILIKIYFLLKIFFLPKNYFNFCKSQNQNEENLFLKKLSDSIENKFFVEIGFHHTEFNSIGLIENGFSGQLIDGGKSINVIIMRFLMLILKKKVSVYRKFITTENINNILEKKEIGCLSIDIDGNDYWILNTILKQNILPEVIIVEYNPSFLDKNISIPYSHKFNRLKAHKSGFYHGASLSAFEKLLKDYNYNLVKCIGGVNAIFVSDKVRLKNNLKKYLASEIYAEGHLRNKWSGLNATQQYELIKYLPIEKV